MSTLFKILAAIALALLVSGFDTDYLSKDSQVAYKEIKHVVQSGETLWGIGEKYYDGSKPFAEFMYDLRNNNGFQVGNGRKYLQVGDVVVVRVKEK